MKKYHPKERKKNSLKRRNPRNTQWKAKAMPEWKSMKQAMFRMRPPQVAMGKREIRPQKPHRQKHNKKPHVAPPSQLYS